MSDFTNNQDVISYIERAQKLKTDNKRFSDVEDADGFQYVDLVQEGGGVLGIALVGYSYILEKAGIRFFSLAGTSAGAINTMMTAALGNIGDPVSEKILDILAKKNLFDFVDGEKAVKKIINKAVSGKGGMVWTILPRFFKLKRILKKKLGLNPGNDFLKWIDACLAANGVKTMADLEALRKTLPTGLKHKTIENMSFEAKLALITSDITTHTKAEFPKMAHLYWKDPANVKPSILVRASMSIPIFFEPLVARNIPDAGQKEHKEWKDWAGYNGPVPPAVKFVDGGMLSNFPINVFHREDGGVPSRPTFGVRLSSYRESFSENTSVFGMCGAMISTMRQIHDYDFLLKNKDYKQLICKIDADESFNWLNFNMSKEQQVALFTLGAKKAIEFLEEFDWNIYKYTRAGLKN